MGYDLTRKECIGCMRYNNNDDIVALVDNYLNINGIRKTFLAEKMGITRQRLNTIFQKKNINLDDLKQIADALGLDVEINLAERDKKEKRILGQKENELEALEQQQRQMMNNFNMLVLVQYQTMENVGKLTTQLEEIYKTIETLNKRTERIEEENETTKEEPALKEAEQSEADGMESEEMK